MIIDDKDIIRAIREKSEIGFRLLMQKYKQPIYWHIRRLVVTHDDAQDATQEAVIRIFRSFDKFRNENSFRGWIFRIATNEALRLIDSQSKTKFLWRQMKMKRIASWLTTMSISPTWKL